MTVQCTWSAWLTSIRAGIKQTIIVLLINVPSFSCGLAIGWISLVSGAGGPDASSGAVISAVTTYGASFVGVPLSARALVAGRKVALIGTSFLFVICWTLKLASIWGGSWCIVAARVAAGLGAAAAWALSPLLAREMCSERYRGAAVTALSLANNAGVLAMYLAADSALPHRTVLWLCLALALLHCAVFTFVPESPSFLAAKGKLKEARISLAWFRSMSVDDPALKIELAALPPPEQEQTPFSLIKEMLKDLQRRRAFTIGAVAVIGQEVCGVLAIIQYAERVFALASEETKVKAVIPGQYVTVDGVTSSEDLVNSTLTIMALEHDSMSTKLMSPTRHAVIIGVVQLLTSALSLYLVERVGRRPLLISCSMVTGGSLALASWLLSRNTIATTVAIAVAIAGDSAGLEPAPYAVLADMFDYQYRGCAMMLVTAAACIGNAIEVAVFPAAVAIGGLRTALILAAAITLTYALFTIMAVPETRGKSPEEIYDAIYPLKQEDDCESGEKVFSLTDCGTKERCEVKETVCAKL